MGDGDTPGRQEHFQTNYKLELTNGYDLTICLEISLFPLCWCLNKSAGVRLDMDTHANIHIQTCPYSKGRLITLPLASFSALSK